MNALEFRVAVDTWPDADLMLRGFDDLADGRTFRGYAAIFDSPSEKMPGPMGAFTERISPGAFTRTLADKRNRIRLFVNHNTDMPLASTRSGTLTLAEDERGLSVEAVLPDTTSGRDLSVLIRSGIVDSMSFGFNAIKDAWSESGTERTLKEVRLHEVSVVTGWPAYSATSASVRLLADATDADPDALAEAFRVLRAPDERLTEEQRDLLMSAINARVDHPFVGARLAHWQSVLASRAV
jgi:uncharacterized protein